MRAHSAASTSALPCVPRASSSTAAAMAGALTTCAVNAAVVTQNPGGTAIPEILASSPRLAALPPASATWL